MPPATGQCGATFSGAIETGRPAELTLEQVFADFAYLDAAYRSKASGRPEVPRRPATPAGQVG